jgi:hypothetical protein
MPAARQIVCSIFILDNTPRIPLSSIVTLILGRLSYPLHYSGLSDRRPFMFSRTGIKSRNLKKVGIIEAKEYRTKRKSFYPSLYTV